LRNEDTFVKVSNKEVYEQLISLREELRKNHEEVRSRLDVTNGKVKRSLWMATTAMSFSLLIIGLLFNHLGK
jgi:uncharacterized coiled-coil DUF342 family protein